MRIPCNRKFLAALTAAAMGIVSLPAVISSSAADDVIYATGFEAGEEIVFTGRGGVEVIESSTEQAHGGDAAMCVSGREKSWNGPQLLLDDICEPGVEYTVSA
ncbi:MAG: carbohydrate binding domain-containing protein [Oscillospiraceae bacterium]|nr:carbohydrate binding domain-containing protein [Oscillospiraceae bacterium]